MLSKHLTAVSIPDGQYQGIWSGYTLEWEFNGDKVYVTTSIGVRGINIPVKFTVRNGNVDEGSILVKQESD